MKPLTDDRAAGLVLCLCLAGAGTAFAAPSVAIEGVADGGLHALLDQAVTESGPAPRSAAEARHRAVAATRDAVALLRSEGYYQGTVEPGVSPGPAYKPIIRVTPGPRFHLKRPTIDWDGAAPDDRTAAQALAAVGLAPNAPARAADIIAAEGRVIARLRKLGYADAEIRPRLVVVDHADLTVSATFKVAAGARARLGAIRSLGKGRTKARWLASLRTWKTGTTYDPALLAKLEKRILDTGAFEVATVDLAPPASGAGAREVNVTVSERKTYSLELGAGYSTTEGSGVDAKWTRYNRLGLGDSQILTFKLYDIQQRLDLEQDLPDWGRPDQTLKIGGGFLGDRTAAYDDLGGGVRADVTRHFDKTTSVTLGVAFDFASTREKTAVNLLATPVGESLDLYIGTLLAGFVLDRSNSILDPTRGWRLTGDADPTVITGGRNLEYLKVQSQLSGYLPIGDVGTVVAARVKFGSILGGGSTSDVPADRRFYAGGGGSVRGYGYQDVGPRLSDNTPEGGLSLTEGSIEVRQKLSRRWGIVAFADTGAVGTTEAPTFNNLAFGAGVGVRYDLGFAPIRLDLATPINPRLGDSRVQVYISIGQSF